MLNIIFPRRAAATDGWSPVCGGSVKTRAGVDLNEEKALTYSAVWCATRVIAETLSSLPLFTYRRTSGYDREIAFDHPLFNLLKISPDPNVETRQFTSKLFRESRTVQQVNMGNGFAEIEREAQRPDAPVIALHPIHASRVQPVRPIDNLPGYSYIVRNNDGTSSYLASWEMLHIPGVLSGDGIWGKGVITYARESIGLGLATERHGATYFGAGGQPRGIVYGPGLKDPEARSLFRAEWKQMHGSPDSGEIALLPLESKWESISITNENSQFLETRRLNSTVIAQWYRLPPHMISDLTRSTNSNIETQSIEFITYSMLPWSQSWEQQLSLKLIQPHEQGQVFIEHKFDSLLRGDVVSRMNSYHIALSNGIMSINEVRRLENLNSIGPAGDIHYVPLNMTTAEAMFRSPPEPGKMGSAAKPLELASHEFDKWTHWFATRKQGRKKAVVTLPPPNRLTPQLEAAAKDVMSDTLYRFFTKEQKAVERIVRNRSDFDQWVAEFYPHHQQLLQQALVGAVKVANCVGYNLDIKTISVNLVDTSRKVFSDHYNQRTPAQFLKLLETWPADRVKIEIENIFGLCKEESQNA